MNFTLPQLILNSTLKPQHASYFRSTPRFIHDGLPLLSYIPRDCIVLSVPHLIELGKIWEDWQYDVVQMMYSNDLRVFNSDYDKGKKDRHVVILHTNEVLLSYREYVILQKLYNMKFNDSFNSFFDRVQEMYKETTKETELDILLQEKISQIPSFEAYVSIICKNSDVEDNQ